MNAPLTEKTCGFADSQSVAAKLAALSHPARIEILRHLS
ncbi:MAG: transcriptional regulator, partial [Mesorhizobium sp.]